MVLSSDSNQAIYIREHYQSPALRWSFSVTSHDYDLAVSSGILVVHREKENHSGVNMVRTIKSLRAFCRT